MRTLVIGAGAVGGYFGGRLLAAQRDITFLVRPARAAVLARDGLRIHSPAGDAALPHPPTVLAGALRPEYDLVLLSCKAYDLDDAIAAFAPAVGPETAILPLLNGMRHLDALDARFGPARVLGGQCKIAAMLNQAGEIVHLNNLQELSFGEQAGGVSSRARAIEAELQGAGFKAEASAEILLEMWEKWVMLASLAGGTCLMRANVGDIAASPGGVAFMQALLEQCRAIAAAEGYVPRAAFVERTRQLLTAAGSSFTASMLRDLERGAPIEADHIIGDLLRRGLVHGMTKDSVTPLGLTYTHLRAYEAARQREMKTAP